MSDENGLVYMRARYYSPTFKRFINADVVAGSITNAITLNRYAYANGNPVSNVDPFGLSVLLTLGICLFGGVIGGVVNAVTSMASQYKDDGEIELEETLVNAALGFASGFVAFSPLGPVASFTLNTVLSVAGEVSDLYYDAKDQANWTGEISGTDIAISVISVGIDVLSSGLGGASSNYEDVMTNAIERAWKSRKREKRRANRKVASKRIKSAIDTMISTFSKPTVEYCFGESISFTKDCVLDSVKDTLRNK